MSGFFDRTQMIVDIESERLLEEAIARGADRLRRDSASPAAEAHARDEFRSLLAFPRLVGSGSPLDGPRVDRPSLERIVADLGYPFSP